MAKQFTVVSETTAGDKASQRTGLIVVEVSPTIGMNQGSKARYTISIDWWMPFRSVIRSEVWCMGQGWREVLSLFGGDPKVEARMSADVQEASDRLTMMRRILNEVLRPQTLKTMEW